MKILRKIRFLFEFVIIKGLFTALSIFPINFVSKFGAFIFLIFGRFSKAHIIAINNCHHVFPKLNKKEISTIVNKSWMNLGQTIFELGILNKIFKKKSLIKINGLNNIKDIIEKKNPAIFFSIHNSNWEICVPLLDRMEIKIGAIYRHINNYHINKFILNLRKNSLKNNLSFYTPKGKQSAKDILEGVKKNGSIFLLIDQKDSAGENVMLFNKSIKTQTGFLKIARKYKLPLVPMENKRLKNSNFEINFHKPILYEKENISDLEMMHKIHNMIESWIIKNPNQWFWQHNRFN